METPTITPSSFRDKLGNVDEKGNRSKIFPKKPSGKFYKYRTYVSWVLLAFLFAGPFISIGGRELLLFNILERKFVFFGVLFGPHDFHLVVLGVLTLVVFIVLFTAVFGRLFCGWVCPQTIFLEMVFRKIEYLIDGSDVQQRKLAKAPLTGSKIRKRVLKHSIFFTLSFLIANTFLAYIIGIDELWAIVTVPPSEHVVGFIAITVFSLLFYGVFARFREQACIVVCPYGRFQSALVTEDSIAVSYDFERGDPRSKFSAKDKEDQRAGREIRQDSGDCIDCNMCVKVCPTGIDIRNGIQLECVNCTACIDACDEIMVSVGKPTGLIRYASLNQIRESARGVFTPRVVAYSVVLALMVTAFGIFASMRDMTESIVLRQQGTTFSVLPDGRINNFMTFKINNKTDDTLRPSIVLATDGGEMTLLGTLAPAAPSNYTQGRFLLAFDLDSLPPNNHIEFNIVVDGNVVEQTSTRLLVPEKRP